MLVMEKLDITVILLELDDCDFSTVKNTMMSIKRSKDELTL